MVGFLMIAAAGIALYGLLNHPAASDETALHWEDERDWAMQEEGDWTVTVSGHH